MSLDAKTWEPYKTNYEKIGQDPSNIIIIEDFLEKSDRELILQYLDQYKDDANFSGGKDIRFSRVKQENRTIYALQNKYQDKIYAEIKKHYMDKYDLEVAPEPWNSLHFVKWRVGMASALHTDCLHPNGEPVEKSSYYKLNIAGLMYPGEDYEGGRIVFPSYGVDIKPKPGTLILFPTVYQHEVTKVTSGVRYTMPIWYTFSFTDKDNEGVFKDLSKTVLNKYDFNDSKGLWINPGDPDKHLDTY
jgi:predicted 2-oxoglutarate/Fe(II)-dependent dioxygenase YbiX